MRLATFIQQRYKKQPNILRVSIKFDELAADLLLRDSDALRRALQKMADDLRPDFEFNLMTVQQPQSVMDTDPRHWPHVPTGYTVVLEDRAALARYVLDMEQQLRASTEHYQFVLSYPAKHEAALTLEGSTKKPYVMRMHARRYKLLQYLAEKKKPVSTQNLVDFLNTRDENITTEDVRGAVEEIRTQVEKKFNIPRSSIVQNDRSGTGYFIDNVRIIEPTRDTL